MCRSSPPGDTGTLEWGGGNVKMIPTKVRKRNKEKRKNTPSEMNSKRSTPRHIIKPSKAKDKRSWKQHKRNYSIHTKDPQ